MTSKLLEQDTSAEKLYVLNEYAPPCIRKAMTCFVILRADTWCLITAT